MSFRDAKQIVSAEFGHSDERSLLYLFVAIAAAVRLWFVGNVAWADERILMRFVGQMSAVELAVELPVVQPHFPVFYVLVDAVGVVGLPLVTGRVFSVIAGAALPVAVWSLGRQVSPRIGLVAAGLAAVSPSMVHIGWWLRPYSLFALFVCISAVALLEAEDARSAAVFVGVAAVATYLHPFGIFALCVWTVWAVGERGRSRLLGVAVSWIVAAPGVWMLGVKVFGPSSGPSADQVHHVLSPATLPQLVLTPAATVFGTLWTGEQQLLGLLFLGLLSVGVWRAKETRVVQLCSLWVISILVGVAVLSYLHPIYQLKYLVWTAVPMFVLVAAARETMGRDARLVFDLVVAILLVSSFVAMSLDGVLMANAVAPEWTSVYWMK